MNRNDFKAAYPLAEGQANGVRVIEKEFQTMFEILNDYLPEGPQKTATFRSLLQTKWTATHAITHIERPTYTPPTETL